MVLLWLMLLACGLFAHGVFECRGLLEAAGNYDEIAFFFGRCARNRSVNVHVS